MSNDTSTTTVTGSTGAIATLTVTQGTDEAYLTVPAADMAKPDAPLKYYATTNQAITDSENSGVWLKGEGSTHDEDKTIDLGGISLSGDNGETYSCTYTITLTKEDGDDMIEALTGKTGNIILNISAPSGATFSEGYTSGSDFDLSSLATSETKEFKATFELDNSNSSKTFDATLYLVNKTEKQDELIGKTLNLKFTTKGACELKTSPSE